MPSDPFERSSESEPKPDSPLTQNIPVPHDIPARQEYVEQILDEQITFIRRESYQKFLVRWRGRPATDATWITREELQRLAPYLLAEFDEYQQQQRQESDSIEPSSFHPGRVDEDIITSTIRSRRGQHRRST